MFMLDNEESSPTIHHCTCINLPVDQVSAGFLLNETDAICRSTALNDHHAVRSEVTQNLNTI